jgi:hypothetical protein
MSGAISRRELAAALCATPLLAAPQAAQPPESPDALLAAARENLRRSAEILSRFPLPLTAEPAIIFKP